MIALDDELRLRAPGLRPATAARVRVRPGSSTTPAAGRRCPARPVRTAGEPESGDAAVDEAAYGVAGALALFDEVYGRSSYDGAGATVVATVHYGRDYVNAFWDGAQLVFGDGDGEVFDRFTKPVDVVGHELAHAVTEHTAGLVYQGQSGALNESVSDVFAACLKQRLRGQTAAEADWLIGVGPVPARGPGARAAGHGGARHGVRRPGARARPAARPHGRLRRHRPTTTAASTSTRASPTAPSSSRRSRSAARRRRVPGGSGTPR